MEGKGLIPPNQTGLRKGMGTLDIYTLIYIIIIYIYAKLFDKQADWEGRENDGNVCKFEGSI